MLSTGQWINSQTDRQAQGRITANCYQRVRFMEEVRRQIKLYPPGMSLNIVGDAFIDPNVHVIQPNDFVFFDTEDALFGAQTGQRITVFSTFNGAIFPPGTTNRSVRRRYRRYGVAAARGVVDNMYESDRNGIAIIVRGTVTVMNNGSNTILAGQAFVVRPPDVSKERRAEEMGVIMARRHVELDGNRCVGIVSPFSYNDATADFAGVVHYLLEHTGTREMTIWGYDTAVDNQQLGEFDDLRIRAIELKKFLVHVAFTSWLQLNEAAGAPPPTHGQLESMAIQLGMFEPKGSKSGLTENPGLQRMLFGMHLMGSLSRMPEKFKRPLYKKVESVFPVPLRTRPSFVSSTENETRAETYARLAKEASDLLWRGMAKSFEDALNDVAGYALTSATAGSTFDAMLA